MAWLILVLVRARTSGSSSSCCSAARRSGRKRRALAGRGERRDPGGRRPRGRRGQRRPAGSSCRRAACGARAAQPQPRCAAARASATPSRSSTDYAGCVDAMRREVGPRRALRARAVLHLGLGRDDRAVLRGAGARPPSAASTYGSCSTTSARAGIPGYKDFVARLEATEIQWAPMLPIRPFKGEIRRPDLRNHRKILVVDGRVAFSGSQNLIEPGYDKPKNQKLGRDVGRADGPASRARRCSELNVVFATDWFTETGENLRRGRRATRPRRRPSGPEPCTGRRGAGGAERARASPPRTTCGCSTACSTPPSAGSR